MDQDFRPLALHHAGLLGQPEWDRDKQWPRGFNQGIPLHLIVAAIREQANPEYACRTQSGLAGGPSDHRRQVDYTPDRAGRFHRRAFAQRRANS